MMLASITLKFIVPSTFSVGSTPLPPFCGIVVCVAADVFLTHVSRYSGYMAVELSL